MDNGESGTLTSGKMVLVDISWYCYIIDEYRARRCTSKVTKHQEKEVATINQGKVLLRLDKQKQDSKHLNAN